MTIIDDALLLFTEEFRDSVNINNLARALINPYIELLTVQNELISNRWLNTATGQQLDGLGDILGLARSANLSDDDYRALLRFQVFINTCKGTPNELLNAVATLSGATMTRYFEHPIAGFQIFTNGPIRINPASDIEYDLMFNDLSFYNTNDGSELIVHPSFDSGGLRVGVLGSMAPAGVDYFSLSFSLGNTPIFGFGNEGTNYLLELDDTGLFEANEDGSLSFLEMYVNEPGLTSTDGFIGFGEADAIVDLEVNGEVLEVYNGSSIIDLTVANVALVTGGGKFVEGIRDNG